jgi:histone H3/H4
MKVSGKVAEALNKIIQNILNKAADRAKENKRKTIMPQDL